MNSAGWQAESLPVELPNQRCGPKLPTLQFHCENHYFKTLAQYHNFWGLGHSILIHSSTLPSPLASSHSLWPLSCINSLNFINNCCSLARVRLSLRPSYLLNCRWVSAKISSLMGNFTSQLPTMFWILKLKNLTGKPSFCTTRAYFLAASRDSSSLGRCKHN